MTKFLITFGSLFWITCQSPTEDNKLSTIIKTYESYEHSDYEEFPLGDFREERFEQYAQFCDSLKNELNSLNYSLLNEEDQISYSLLDFVLNEALVEYQFKTHWNPILSDAGFHSSLTYRVRPLTNKKSALSYLRILEGIPTYIKQQRVLIEKGLEAGMGQPLVIFRGYESTYNQHITPTAEENFFYSPFLNLPSQFSESEKDSLQEAAKKIVLEKVIPTFEEVKNFFEQEYFLRTRKTLGVSEIPNGKKYYQSRIDYYTTQHMTPENIHSLGLSEVARIRNQMESIIQEVGFKGTFNDFISYLRNSPEFYATSSEMLLKHARNIAKKLDEQLPRYFITLPRKPYGVAAVPASIAPKYTGGRYVGSPKNSTDPGYYWVNTYNLSSRPLYVIPSLTAHEAVPGHHLQGALNQELPDHIPQFRKNLYLSAYGEGWGLYTEYLAEEMGIYETPYEHFGKLTYEMWRACRLVVDTGIHAFGWSRDQAVAYMASNTALSLHEVNTEIDRYISWPGQALSYKIGEIKIRELREKAMQELGSSFDIREFHEEILKRGTLTLPLLENQILNYIEKKRQLIKLNQ